MSLGVRVPVYRAPFDFDSTLVPLDSTDVVPTPTTTPLSVDTIGVHKISPLPAKVAKPPQPRTTKFTLASGAGRYYREYWFSQCTSSLSSTFEQEFIDAGAEIDHQVGQKGRVGIRGG